MINISNTARNRIHNLFRPKCAPIPLGHCDLYSPDVDSGRLYIPRCDLSSRYRLLIPNDPKSRFESRLHLPWETRRCLAKKLKSSRYYASVRESCARKKALWQRALGLGSAPTAEAADAAMRSLSDRSRSWYPDVVTEKSWSLGPRHLVYLCYQRLGGRIDRPASRLAPVLARAGCSGMHRKSGVPPRPGRSRANPIMEFVTRRLCTGLGRRHLGKRS